MKGNALNPLGIQNEVSERISIMIRTAKALVIVSVLAVVSRGNMASAQSTTASDKAASDKAAAYYNFAMAHLYAEQAGQFGNRSEFVNKAIDHYRQALKLDPSASYIFEELTDLYIQTGHIRDAVTEAQDMLKRNGDNLDARRILGRIYTRMIGDAQQGKINEDMLKQAIEQYKQITARDTKDMESWLALGRLYRVAGDSVESEKSYKRAMELDPNNEDALTGLAVVYSDVGDTKKAIEMLRVVTERDPSPRTLEALAQAYDQVRDYKSAAEVLKKAIELAPDNARYKRQLAQNLLLSEQYDDALQLYTQLASEDPKDAQTQLRISEIYRQKHEYEKARAALDKARELDSDNLDVRYEEVNLLADQGKTDESIKVLKGMLDDMVKKSYSASEKSNRLMLLERLSQLYRGAKKYPEAMEVFKQMSELDPESNAIKLAHASLLAEMGQVDEGVAEVRKLHSGEKPKDRELELAVAQLYERGKRYPEMAKALDAAEKLSDTPQDKEGVNFMRGAMYEHLKKYDAAEAEFRKVLAMSPDDAKTLNYLGYMFAEAGIKLEEAGKLVGRALEIDPGNGAYLDSLGWVYYRQNRLPEAENMLVQALAKIGKDPTVHDHLGDIYFKQGKTRDAINQWQASMQEYEAGISQDMEPADAAKINKKLESAKVRLAKESGGPDKR
jgi:tetratricopeptide (TPR) repeat protein